jgi:hypothetical protein
MDGLKRESHRNKGIWRQKDRHSRKLIEQTMLDKVLIYFNGTLAHVVEKITQ